MLRDRTSVAINVCPVHGGRDVARFVVPPDDADEAAKWQRWDRLAWRTRAIVDFSGELTYCVVFEGISDLAQTPDPGPEPRPIPRRSVGRPSAYRSWIDRFARAAYNNDASEASDLWDEAAAKTWVFPATVKAVGDDQVLVSLTTAAHTDATVTRRIRGREPNTGVRVDRGRAEVVGRWGLGPDDIAAVVLDEQLVGALSVGTKVDVTIELDSDGARTAMRGPFPVRVAIWRVTR
jgi:hypothetical protein